MKKYKLPEGVQIRAATKQDLESFYDIKWSETVRAWIASWKGKDALVAGYVLDNGRPLAFSDMKENDASPLIRFRVARQMLKIMREHTINLYAPEGNIRFLEMLGFEPTDMKIEETPLYRCRNQ